MLRLRPLLEANYQAWMESRSLREKRNAPGDARLGVHSPVSSHSSEGKPLSRESRSPPVHQRPLRISSGALAMTSEAPYIPMVTTREEQRPKYIREVRSPPSHLRTSTPVPASSAGSPLIAHRLQTSSHPSSSNAARPTTMSPTSPAPLKGIRPGPIFDSKRIQIPIANSDKPSQPLQLPAHPHPTEPIQAGYQYQARRPATMIPITSQHAVPTISTAHRALVRPPKSVPVKIPIRSPGEDIPSNAPSPVPSLSQVPFSPSLTSSPRNDAHQGQCSSCFGSNARDLRTKAEHFFVSACTSQLAD